MLILVVMKIIHTADWHLGQTFFEYDRRAEHVLFLRWLREQVSIHGVDVLLIAGDVFDSPNPSADSQRMYYRFLCDITSENPDLQIVITAGNHDSANRLESPTDLLDMIHVSVRGVVRRTPEGDFDLDYLTVPLHGGGICLAVPYLRQGDYPTAESYGFGVKKLYDALYDYARAKANGGPIIAMGHLQATGSEISEDDRSERTVIGGLECVSPDAFSSGIAYTALGHLHRAQRVSGRENVRYSGAPIAMSFAERNNKQGVVLVTVGEEATHTENTDVGMAEEEVMTESAIVNHMQIDRLAFQSPVPLISIPKTALPLADVLEEINHLPAGPVLDDSPFLEIKVRVEGPEPSLRYQIEQALEGKAVRLARIALTTPEQQIAQEKISYEQLQTMCPLDIAEDVYERNYGGHEMPEELKEMLQQVIREVENEDISH